MLDVDVLVPRRNRSRGLGFFGFGRKRRWCRMWGETFGLFFLSLDSSFFWCEVAEDLAQVGLSFGLGLGLATEVAGFMKGLLFLTIEFF